MSTFLKQIEEDILEYRKEFGYINNISKDEWAFNFWVMDKLFKVDEELIEDRIIDYKDYGVDAYEIYEDKKEIYLIQNKYYHDTTKITAEYVKNDFLLRPINALLNGTFNRSEELQKSFTKLKHYEEFTVFLEIYITNNLKNNEVEKYVKEFNIKNPKFIAKVYYLDDIETKYFGEIFENKKNLDITIESVNSGTVLNINSDNYRLKNVIDARYVMTPVTSIFKIYCEAIEKDYPIFEKNIREFLGNKGINKKIYETLMDEDEKLNFFYYNNGITIICDSMSSMRPTREKKNNMNICFDISNPQIVNGCQTVNSIYEALNNISKDKLESVYKDVFVMIKILIIDRSNENQNELYKNIVKYNNSQNAIDEKTFAANIAVFKRIQDEFEAKGLLLLIKQSDRNKFYNKYNNDSKFKNKITNKFEKYGIKHKSITDWFVPLEKLLQVLNAFSRGGHFAYLKKSNMLKQGTKEYEEAIDFLKDPCSTIDSLIDLYLLYKLAEQVKKQSENNKTPIPYYLIDMFAKYECKERNKSLITINLNNSEKIRNIIELYSKVTKAYMKDYHKEYDVEYNKMIKQNINYEMMEKYRDILCE